MNPVLVVGGTRGTGLLVARLLARNGRRVRVLARQPEEALRRLGTEIEIVPGDVTEPISLQAAIRGISDIVFTAGVRSGRVAGQSRIKAVDYQGVVNTLEAQERGIGGRFVYMTSIGGATPSIAGALLNAFKGDVLTWRRRAEDRIRASGVDYAIVRAGFLLNAAGGRRALHVTQGNLPLAPRYRIARADAAEACVAALEHPGSSRVTFEVVWSDGPREDWRTLLGRLEPDTLAPSESRFPG